MIVRTGLCTPIVFYPALGNPTAPEMLYTQHFGRYDHILVQFMADEAKTVTLGWYTEPDHTFVGSLTMSCVPTGSRWWIYYASIPVLDAGCYRILAFWDSAIHLQSADFQVLDDPTLGGNSLLFEYSNTDNDMPTGNIFIADGFRRVFRFRIEGGFKPDGVQHQVAQETWRTQSQELRMLYSVPYERRTLTIGNAAGVPVEYIGIVNGILSCDMVYINGQRWCRSEGSVPEKQLTMQGAQMFTASVDVERQWGIDDYPTELYGGNGDYNEDYNNDFDKI